MLRSIVLTLLVAALVAPIYADTQKEVLVFGGSGRLGSEIVRSLLAKGHRITVFVRPTSDRSRLEKMDVSYAVGDVLVGADVEAVLQSKQFDVVIDALSRGRAPAAFYEQSMAHIARSASQNHVSQIILHGSVGAGDSGDKSGGFSSGMKRVMDAKTAAENLLKASGVPYTIIRNWAIKPHGTPATGQARLVEDVGVRTYITRADLGALTAECLMVGPCLNKTYHAADNSW